MNAMRGLWRWLTASGSSDRGFKRRSGSWRLGHTTALLLLLAASAPPAKAQYQFRTEVNPDGTLTVYRGTSCPSGELIIPDAIDGRQVTGIGDGAFNSCSSLSTVLVPRGVTSIKNFAFNGCQSLTNITILGSVTSIGIAAFSACALTSINIPNSVTSIGHDAFSFCTGLTSIAIPDSVTIIGENSFRESGLTSIDIPGTVTSIGAYAFQRCKGLTEVTLGRGTTSIAKYTFKACGSLTNVTIPDTVANIGSGAFFECTSLNEIVIPGRISSWGDGVWNDPFGGLNGSGPDWWWWDDRHPKGTFQRSGVKNVLILGGADHIGDGAFVGCANLTNVTMLGSIASIGNLTFVGCTSLTEIHLPDSVNNLGVAAFLGCTSLTGIYFTGNAPEAAQSVFFANMDGDYSPTTVHYLPGTTGWTSTFAGRPTAPWHRPSPTILDFGDRFGPSPNGFSFVISWATNVPVVVEASADITGQGWTPISTNTLTDGWVRFSDPDWKSQPARFYRVRGE